MEKKKGKAYPKSMFVCFLELEENTGKALKIKTVKCYIIFHYNTKFDS